MKFVAFDVETTGVRPSQDKIIEIGAVKFDGDQSVESFGLLVNPGITIPFEASSVNGITDEMVQGKPRIDNILGTFAEFCGDLPLVAHNAPFDYKFLKAAVDEYRAPAPQGIVLDTLPLARKVFPGLPNYKLGTIVRRLNIPAGRFHRAEEDSAYCGMVMIKILEVLHSRGESPSAVDLARMMDKVEMRFPQYAAEPDQLDLF